LVNQILIKINEIQFKPSRQSQEIPSLKSQTLFHELNNHLGANRSPLTKYHQILKFQEEILANSIEIRTLELLTNLVRILNIVRFEFQIQTLLFYSNQAG
jgi:hypothetical protein